MTPTETPSLDGARAKLRRSLELLQELQKAVDAERKRIADTGDLPIKIAFRDEVDEDRTRWRVCRCVKTLRKPPQQWAVLAGDAMHNARASLDHLVCRLVELNGNTPTKQNAFPIWDVEPKTRQKRGQFETTIEGMAHRHKDGIRKLQPWKNPAARESAMLVALAALDNLDKHQALVPLTSTTAPTASARPVSPALPVNALFRWNSNVEMKPGVEIFRTLSLSNPGGASHLRVQSGVRVTFGDSLTGLSELGEIRSHCVGIVESFAPDFG